MMRTPELSRLFVAASLVLCACRSDASIAPPSDPPLSDPRGLILLGTVAYPAELYVMRPDGSGLRRLTNDSLSDLGGDWSPDGRSIVFMREQLVPGSSDRRMDIFAMNADGNGMRRVHQAPGVISGPRWSPDGRRIAFARSNQSQFRDSASRIEVMAADGSDAHIVTPLAGSIAPDWAPDGTRLLYLARRPDRPRQSMYTSRLDGTEERLIGGDLACVLDVHDATWSPDGSRIVYRCSDAPDYVIQVINADGSSPVRLSLVESARSNSAFDLSPVWSPDGSRIAFGSTRGGNPTAPWMMDVTGVNVSPIGGAALRGLIPVDWGAAPR